MGLLSVYINGRQRIEDGDTAAVLMIRKSTLGISGVPHEFCSCGGGVQQIQLRTDDRQNGDLGAVAP